MVISLVIPLYSGGDHFGLHRFVMPFIPIIILLGMLLLEGSNFFKSNINMFILVLLLFFSNEYNLKNVWINRNYPIKVEWDISLVGRNSSQKLNIFFKDCEKLPSQGVLTAGGTAFGYNGETVDLLALNNTKMAHADKVKDRNLLKNHASFNKNIFFDLSPDLFWYSQTGFVQLNAPPKNNITIDTSDFTSRVFKNIQKDERFVKKYGFFRIVYNKNHDEALEIFANKMFISKLDTSMYKITDIDYE